MPRELLILRHGKSDWNTGAADDFERPLAKRGRKAIKRIAGWIRDHGLEPDYIVSSPAERARQTALRLCRHAGLDEGSIRWEPSIYEAAPDALLDALAACPPEPKRIMLVGHNPGLDSLARYLDPAAFTGQSAEPNPVPTGALLRLRMPDDWSRLERGCATLLSATRPRDLLAG
jgi:phosphohistidine phosphatase